ncbi:MAG: archease [Candidatus Bathyarchaeia archaeon]
MVKKKGFEFLEHTADAYIAAYGKDLAEAFENAALAMFETMTDTKKVKPLNERTVEARGSDTQSLLYNWLEKLLVMFEVERMLLSKFRIEKILQTELGFMLFAKVYGEPYDSSRHKQKVGVKAVTYHRMELDETANGVVVKFILDI